MNKIYATGTKGKEQMLVGLTYKMLRDGKTPEEISIKIKQTIERVNKCILICEKTEEKRLLIKSKTCDRCIHDKDKDTCACKRECVRDAYGNYTEYFRDPKKEIDM